MAGIPALREQIAQKVESCYGRSYDVAHEITVTAGATQAIQTALTAIVHPGDEVIVLEPVYDSYEPVIRMNGGHARVSRLAFPDFRPDWGEIRALIGPRPLPARGVVPIDVERAADVQRSRATERP